MSLPEHEWQRVSSKTLSNTLRTRESVSELPWSWFGPLTSARSSAHLLERPNTQKGYGRPSHSILMSEGPICPVGPMMPIKRYGHGSYRPDIGVKDLMKLAPGQEAARPMTTVQAGPTSPYQTSSGYTHSISHHRSNGVYTHPGTYDERLSTVGYRTLTRPSYQRNLAPLSRSASTASMPKEYFKWSVSAL